MDNFWKGRIVGFSKGLAGVEYEVDGNSYSDEEIIEAYQDGRFDALDGTLTVFFDDGAEASYPETPPDVAYGVAKEGIGYYNSNVRRTPFPLPFGITVDNL